MIKALIFDCFGVILNDGLEAFLGEICGNDTEKRTQVWDLVKAPNVGLKTSGEFSKEAAEILGLTEAKFVEEVDRYEGKNIPLMEYIKTLRSVYKMAILSNVSSTGLQRRFTEEELAQHFDVVVPSGRYGIAKPDSEIYELTADLLGVKPSECVMIDDREDYCAGAELAGMSSILYRNFSDLKPKLEAILGS